MCILEMQVIQIAYFKLWSCLPGIDTIDSFSFFLTFPNLHVSKWNACSAICLLINFKIPYMFPIMEEEDVSFRLLSPLLFYLPKMTRLQFFFVSMRRLCRYYSYKSILMHYDYFPFLLQFFLELLITLFIHLLHFLFADLSNYFQ